MCYIWLDFSVSEIEAVTTTSTTIKQVSSSANISEKDKDVSMFAAELSVSSVTN